MDRLSKKVIDEFGDEWNAYDQKLLPREEQIGQFQRYFNTKHFQECVAKKQLTVLDFGAGSGRWLEIMLQFFDTKKVVAVEPSSAVDVLIDKFSSNEKFEVQKLAFEDFPNQRVPDSSFDVVCCFGVLHHTQDIKGNFKKLANLAKSDGVIFCYIYYDLEFRPFWFKFIWMVTDVFRRAIARLPKALKFFVCDLIAFLIYFPLVSVGKKLPSHMSRNFPLSHYFDRSFYSMRTDARDRFGTRVEKRMSKRDISDMCHELGLVDVQFSDTHPYWVFSAKK